MWCWLAAPASAVDVDLFVPAASLASGLGTVQGEAPVLGPPGPSVAVVGSYAEDAVLHEIDGEDHPAVAVLAPVEVFVGVASRRVRVDLAIPAYAQVEAPLSGWAGPAFGDLRLQATVPLGCVGREALCAALVPRALAPTGTPEALVAAGPSAGLVAAFGGTIGPVGWVTNAGATAAPQDALGRVPLGPASTALAGLWAEERGQRGSFRAGVEAQIRQVLSRGTAPTADAHGFVQARTDAGFALTLGAGVGLLTGVGSPALRIVGGLGWTLSPAPSPRPEVSDALVSEAETPPPEPAPAPPPPPPPPPPPDTDGDTLEDQRDACPTAAGPAASAGCPDTDGDGVVDVDDPCPAEPAPTGCPPRAPIVLRPALSFATNAAEIDPSIAADLGPALDTLLHDPRRFEIRGHTDNVGSEQANLALSQARADAVRDWLVSRGVPAERLDARGYGETLPLYTNRTPKGREGNRRIEIASLD